MNSEPLISLITVTYNAQDTIERTLRSIEQQTYRRVEHIIVDGVSADGTMSRIRNYVERNDPQKGHVIRMLREPDKGLYDAMNKGIQLATGDYICFLNAGDKLHTPTTLAEIAKQTEWESGGRNYAILYGETDLVDNEGRFLRHRRLQTPQRLTWSTFKWGMLVCHQSFYVRTDLAKTVPYNLAYRFSADYDWCIRLMKIAEGRKLKNLNTHLVLTDYLSEGMTTRNHRSSLLERLRIMATHFGWGTTLWQHALFVGRAIIKK